MSPIKEPNHFCTDIDPAYFSEEFKRHEKQKNLNLELYLNGPMKEKHWGYFVQRKQDYEKLFKNRTTERAAVEVSNSYLYSSKAAENIWREIPNAKIVIMLRNPAFAGLLGTSSWVDNTLPPNFTTEPATRCNKVAPATVTVAPSR